MPIVILRNYYHHFSLKSPLAIKYLDYFDTQNFELSNKFSILSFYELHILQIIKKAMKYSG